MKTIPKVTWINYLIIGLFISFTPSCGKIREYVKYSEFVYVNQTSHVITFPKGIVTINIKPNETISSKISEEGADKNLTRDSYLTTPKAFDTFDVYKIMYFDNLRCLDLSKDFEHSPAELKNYVAEKIGKRTYKFTYTFTEADYNRAVACP